MGLWATLTEAVFVYLRICTGCFLDTQVSLAPTHVRWLVSKLVSKSVTLSDFQSLVAPGMMHRG